MKIDEKYIERFNFTEEQINNNFKNAYKDLGIAQKDKILEVKFT